MRRVFNIFIFLTQILFAFSENLITFNEFKKAVTDNTYPTPSREQYDTIMRMAAPAGGITTKHELAMFLAQVLWESAGLQFKKEIKCATSSCPSDYRTGREKEGKYYFGRGYIQLTWLYNYEQCSQELYGDQRLVDNPDLVSDTEEGAWGSAFWYWRKHCHTSDGVKKGQFGASTMAINGVLECKGPYKVKAFKRYTIYVRILRALHLSDVKPQQEGCYPMPPTDGAPDFRLCESVGVHKNAVGMYGWCNDNCNAEDPNCPSDMCGCEGGNPVKKAKNETKSEAIDTNSRSRLPNQIEPKLVAKSSEFELRGVRVDRLPPKPQFPTTDPYSQLELINVTENAKIVDTPSRPVPVYQSEPIYVEPIPQPAVPVMETAVPENKYRENIQNHRLDGEPKPQTPEPPKDTPIKDIVIPYRNRRPNPHPPRARESHPETGPVRVVTKVDKHIDEDDLSDRRRMVEPVVRRRTLPNSRLNTNVERGGEETRTERPMPELKSGWGTDLFKYHEPMRISRNRGATTPAVTPSVAVANEEPIRTEQPDTSGRTRLLRNELGRLIRKRPVNRGQQSN